MRGNVEQTCMDYIILIIINYYYFALRCRPSGTHPCQYSIICNHT
jgi:hypothetical protein